MKKCSKCGKDLGGFFTAEHHWKFKDGTKMCDSCYGEYLGKTYHGIPTKEEEAQQNKEKMEVLEEKKKIENEMKKSLRKLEVNELIRKLGGPDIQTRIVVAMILGEKQNKKAIGALMEALKDGNDEVVTVAAEALAKIRDPRVLNDLNGVHKRFISEIKRIDRQQDDNSTLKGHFNYQLSQILLEQYVFYVDAEVKISKAIEKLRQAKFERMAKVVDTNLKEMSWQDFEDTVTDALNAVPSEKRTSDMGLDGITSDGIPVQIKQSERIGRNVIDNFETAIRRYCPSDKRNLKGIIVAFSFTKGAYTEADRVRREENIDIQLITADELII